MSFWGSETTEESQPEVGSKERPTKILRYAQNDSEKFPLYKFEALYVLVIGIYVFKFV